MAEQLGLINGMELQHTDDATKTLFFDDGIRRIDYVLAYDDEEDEEELQKNSDMRKEFLENLLHQGLQYEEALSTKVICYLGHFIFIFAVLKCSPVVRR